MKQWEYTERFIFIGAKDLASTASWANVVSAMNDMGLGGWELASVTRVAATQQVTLVAIYKRPI